MKNGNEQFLVEQLPLLGYVHNYLIMFLFACYVLLDLLVSIWTPGGIHSASTAGLLFSVYGTATNIENYDPGAVHRTLNRYMYIILCGCVNLYFPIFQ